MALGLAQAMVGALMAGGGVASGRGKRRRRAAEPRPSGSRPGRPDGRWIGAAANCAMTIGGACARQAPVL
jgi:hypothetical protein